MRGTDPNLIRMELRRQAIQPLKVRKKSKPLFKMGNRVVPKDIMLLSRQLCTMLRSGIAVVQALEMFSHTTKKPALQNLVKNIKSDVEGGTPFAEALAKYPMHFDRLYCSLVQAGEEAGVLERVLDKIAVHLEKAESIKSKVKKAFTYPSIVLFFAFIVSTLLLIYVIPTFEGLFQGFGADLPALTRFVIDLSKTFQEWWFVIMGTPVAAIILLLQARKRSKNVHRMIDRAVLGIPLIGKVVSTSSAARFARTLATMFEGGVPLVESMESVAGATGNVIYEQAVLDMRDAVAVGQQLNFAMRQSNLFDNMVVQMISIGEESGSLGVMLNKVADFYEEEVDNRLDVLTTFIEPALMAFLAVVVGGLVIAMYLPIFKLASAIQ